MTGIEWRSFVCDLLRQDAELEEVTMEDGTELFGRTPWRGTEAWHHLVFSPLSSDAIKSMEKLISCEFPEEIRNFYEGMNGLSLFSGSLGIYGLRTSYQRTNFTQRQPFDIATPNKHERIRTAPASAIFLATYSKDGSHIYLDGRSGALHHCPRFSAEPLRSWPDMATMIRSEISRMAMYYAPDGRPRPGAPGSAPPPSAVEGH
jgi:hypothetical protein